MARYSRVGRLTLFALGAATASLIASSAWAEGSCADDLQKLTQRRTVELSDINTMAEASKKEKKPVDPVVFCAKARSLGATEEALLSYMDKNKDWCAIPDEIIANLKASHAKSVEFGSRACLAAAKAKKQQQEAGSQQAPPALPTGPL
jgi:hypothetical protein